MRICYIVAEYAGIDRWGGFGELTREIAEAMARRGHEVYVVMPRKPNQKPIAQMEGVTVVAVRVPTYRGFGQAKHYAGVLRAIDADVYHSEDPTVLTRVAQHAAPHRKHLVTFQDPRTIEDWRKQWVPRVRNRFEEWAFQLKYWMNIVPGIHGADACYSQAKFVVDKTMKLYGLSKAPEFLPNPVSFPATAPEKSALPTVCFLGRWEDKKRPEMFLELAARFSDVQFILTGAYKSDGERDAALRKQAAGLRNVTAPGWVDAAARSAVLGQSWILINTSTNECLPVSYLEAAAHRCALLAHINADEFPEKYGYWVKEGGIEEFARGLRFLLEGNRWRELGERGYGYVRATHEREVVIDQHLRVYERALAAA
jgi:glycosyltransferase involved in cell wall biosynthesis